MQAVVDDQETTYSTWLIVLGILLGVGLVVLVLCFVLQPPPAFSVRLAAGIGSSLLVGGCLWVERARRRWKRVDQRRQDAASGVHGGAPLSSVQPFPDEAALPLPSVIVHTTSRLRNVSWMIGGCTGSYLVASLLKAFLVDGDVGTAFFLNLPAQWPSLVGVILGALLVSWRRQYVRIEDTDEGLVLSTQAQTKLVGWDDARLFAVRGRGKPGAPPLAYELASAKELITWKPLRRLRWWTIERPEVTFEEYERQMEALLSVIAAKTHLPLYDVREAGE